MLTSEHIEHRLQQILRRGSRTVGGPEGTGRLMVMLTRSCELRCSYCFVGLSEEGYGEEHPGHHDLAWQTGQTPRGDMSRSTFHDAIDLLMTSRRAKLGIQLFGGEPTRRFDVLLDGLERAVSHPKRNNRPLELLLTTNGMGLDEARLRALSSLPVTVELSFDGAPESNRFRRAHLLPPADATERVLRSVALLRASGLRWFMNATLSPAVAHELPETFHFAQRERIPALQLNYATGMRWTSQQTATYLEGMMRVLAEHDAEPGALELFNWQNGADPVPLCGDVIVDVDGTVLQTGAIFHEKRYPSLKAAYHRGHVRELEAFDELRMPLAELWDVTRATLSPEDWAVFAGNVRLGAAVDLVVQLVSRRLRRRRAG